jgi:hypothetical protein
MMTRSSAVRWLHTNSHPGLEGGGGVPFTNSSMPVRRYVWRANRTGIIRLNKILNSATRKEVVGEVSRRRVPGSGSRVVV